MSHSWDIFGSRTRAMSNYVVPNKIVDTQDSVIVLSVEIEIVVTVPQQPTLFVNRLL